MSRCIIYFMLGRTMFEMRATSLSILSQIPTAFLDRRLSAQDLQRLAFLFFLALSNGLPIPFYHTHLLYVDVVLFLKASKPS